MNYEDLHTSVLEKLFGSIDLRIIRQDEDIRIIQLNDKNEISRTLGVVRFLNIESKQLKIAHGKILEGGLLGKTLLDLDIDFDKEFIGKLQVKLPDWLKKDFNTQQDTSLAFFSKILVRTNSLSDRNLLYAELVEIIPPELTDVFVDKTKSLSKIDDNLLSLLKVVDITEINLRKNYD